MYAPRLIVLKFGGSVLATEESLRSVVHEVYRWVRGGDRVIAVISALAGHTDRLLARARQYGHTTNGHAVAQFAMTGELSSAALLGLVLDRAGIPATLLDAAAISLRSIGDPLDAAPAEVDASRLRCALEHSPVVIVPGFIGQDGQGRVTLFGRGGSDLTALFLASMLKADRCRLVKDVDGLYEWDPAVTGPKPRRFEMISWQRALTLDGSIVQHKAVRFAQERQLTFEVGTLHASTATNVGHGPDRLAFPQNASQRPLRVSLLGLGIVGMGVYEAISRLPELFEIVSVAVRDPERACRAGLPRPIVTSDVFCAVDSSCDAVVEAIGDFVPAREAIRRALTHRRDVVSANKAVLAAFGEELESTAKVHGVRLLFSAAAGGAIPILETIQRIAATGQIDTLEATLNGTANYVLDELANGTSLDRAVEEARQMGFAEQDTSRDLDGRDAADKLVLACRSWTGRWLRPHEVRRTPISLKTVCAVSHAHGNGTVMRQVARMRVCGAEVSAEVGPACIPADHRLAQAKGEANVAIIRETDATTHIIKGKGAGRWPTAEAVMADLLDLARERQTRYKARPPALNSHGDGAPR